MKAVVAAFNQEKALVGAFSVITNLRMELFQALVCNVSTIKLSPASSSQTAITQLEVGKLADKSGAGQPPAWRGSNEELN